MPLNLPQISRRPNQRRRYVELRPVVAPAMLASDLFTSIYRPVIALWQEAIPRIVAEYERTLSAMTTDSPADIQSEIEAVESAFERLAITLTPAIRAWALRVERITRERWRGAVLAASNVDLSTVIGPDSARETIAQYVAWNVDLVKDVSAVTKKRIADRVFSGLTERKPAREVAREIREAVAMSRRRSELVAADQLSKVSNALADERAREAGLTEWEWIHSAKRHPREEHQARNGFVYTDNPANVGKRVGGKLVRSPPEASDLPSRKPFCGCHRRALLVWSFDGEGAET